MKRGRRRSYRKVEESWESCRRERGWKMKKEKSELDPAEKSLGYRTDEIHSIPNLSPLPAVTTPLATAVST